MATKAQALKDEAEDAPKVKVFTFKGVEFTVSLDPLDWGYGTMEALEQNRIGAAVDGMLGHENVRKFRALNPTLRDAIEMLGLISSDSGADDAGN
jgi:hypothetical protein